MPDKRSTTDLRSFDNSWYDNEASGLKTALWYFVNVLFFINPLNPLSGLKVWLLRLFGAQIGQRVLIKPAVNIKYPWLLTIGSDCWIGERVWIDNLTRVELGDHVCLSQGAMLLTGNHDYKKTAFDLITGPIVLQDGAWIGAHSIVTPGTTVESHAVLSVNSVGSKVLKAYTIYQGNPALPVRERRLVSSSSAPRTP